ncbi:MAG: 5-formyltetrahydrofolate cyclo-ligase [Comamonadaceae bacterium BICA1-1]|nr:MAG: 5-formyltetrahydrofolate cyclo-ligase [Comamonadaceae bacterium BICA1-1]
MDNKSPLDQPARKTQWRQHLIEQRLRLGDRLARNEALQRVMRVWLVDRPDTAIGAYWPIKGEFDPLPALFRWQEAGREADALGASRERKIGLPVIDKATKTLSFHRWYPGCPMEEDAYDIPKPKGTERITPTLLFVPCVGYGPGGYRLGYGGGFYDRTLAQLQPRPYTVGLAYTLGFLPELEPEPHDWPLDAILNDNGAVWPLG